MWFEHTFVDLLNRFNRRGKPTTQAGLTLGSLTDNPSHTVVWTTVRRPEHACVVGKTGSGKTHFMEWLACQLMERSEPFVFFDYHGDATERLVALATRFSNADQRLVVIDPTDSQSSPGLNPLESTGADGSTVFGRTSELAAILRQRWQVDAFGPRTEELLRNTLFVLAATNHTLVEAPLLLTSQAFRTRLVSQLTQPDILDYWMSRYEPLSEAMKGAFREPLLNKITGFLTEPSCRHLLGQQVSTLRFTDAIERGQWVIVNLAKGKLREHAHTLGNLIFARLQFDVLARTNVPPAQRRLFTVFCDEVQNLAENDLATLLAEGRKFAISLVNGHQFWDQLSKELRGALLSAGTHIFFTLSSNDAAVLSSELSVGAKQRYHRELTLLPRGHAIARVGAAAAVAITIPSLPRVASSAGAIQSLRAGSVGRHSRPRARVEAEIRSRRDQEMGRPDASFTESHATPPDGQQSW